MAIADNKTKKKVDESVLDETPPNINEPQVEEETPVEEKKEELAPEGDPVSEEQIQDDEIPVQVQQSQPQQAAPDDKSLRWQAKNQWFGATGFEEYTSYALGLHHKLVNAGIDPRQEEYFDQIDGRMRKSFPELFGANGEKSPNETPRSKPAAVVAPANRSSGVKKIQLTTTQLALAKKYGLTPQQYAAEVAKLEK